MSKSAILILGLFVCSCTASPIGGHDGERGTATLDKGGLKVSVEYGSPELKGRDLETLIKPGEEWRMGADAATTLVTESDLKFGETLIPKGKYTLKARLTAPQKWLLVLQTADKKTAGEVPLTLQKADARAEHVKILLEGTATGAKFIVRWGNLSLSTEFQKA